MLFRSRKERRRVLIVEDDWAVLEVLKLMLEDAGYVVVTAEHGSQAIASAAAKPFDLVLMDISMPGINGVEVARTLRAEAKTRDVLIAIHTGLDEHWVRERFDDYDLFLTKAADTDLLVDEIGKLFERPRTTRATRNVDPDEHRLTMTEAVRAQQALRDAMSLGAELLTWEALVGMLGDEIDQLRRLGESDLQIAQRIEDAVGKPVPASALGR